MAKVKCEHCKCANMVDDLRAHPGIAGVRAIRVKLNAIKAYDRAGGTCDVHAGRQYRESAQMMEHWTERIARRLE